MSLNDDNDLNTPYEVGSAFDLDTISKSVKEILKAIGEDPTREGLLRTPERVAHAYQEILGGYEIDPVKLINGALFTVDYDEMVIVKDIEYYSLCEHQADYKNYQFREQPTGYISRNINVYPGLFPNR